MASLPPPLPIPAPTASLPPPALSHSPTSGQVLGAVAQVIIAAFIGFMAGTAGPILLGQQYPNQPFDDYRIPGVILLLAVVMLLGAILTGVRRLWFFAGFSAGASLGLFAIGLLALVFTVMHLA